jgi:hypothetical protein
MIGSRAGNKGLPASELSADIPIDARMKQLRGPELTGHQIAQVSKMERRETDPRNQRLFDNAFEVVVEIDSRKEELKNATDDKERKRIEKCLRGLENKITPAVKRAAIARELQLIPLVLRYFREFNGDTNISHCIKWVRAQGAGRSMQDAAMRARIKKVFDIKGQRGRPRGS